MGRNPLFVHQDKIPLCFEKELPNGRSLSKEKIETYTSAANEWFEDIRTNKQFVAATKNDKQEWETNNGVVSDGQCVHVKHVPSIPSDTPGGLACGRTNYWWSGKNEILLSTAPECRNDSYGVFKHEIGNVAGLHHSPSERDIMHADTSVTAREGWKISPIDKKRFLALHARTNKSKNNPDGAEIAVPRLTYAPTPAPTPGFVLEPTFDFSG